MCGWDRNCVFCHVTILGVALGSNSRNALHLRDERLHLLLWKYKSGHEYKCIWNDELKSYARNRLRSTTHDNEEKLLIDSRATGEEGYDDESQVNGEDENNSDEDSTLGEDTCYYKVDNTKCESYDPRIVSPLIVDWIEDLGVIGQTTASNGNS